MLKLALLAGGGGLTAVAASGDPATSGSGVDLNALLQYGPLGIFAVIFVIFAETSYRRETQRSDRIEAENIRLNTLIQEKFIPALENASYAIRESTEVIRDLQAERKYGGSGGGGKRGPRE